TAVSELAKGWREHPDTLPILQQHAQSDDNKYVRSTAVSELAKGWREHPEMFEFLANCAVKDVFVREHDWETNPRQTALEGIIQYFPNHPQTKALLVERSENDPDEQVREFAQQALEELSYTTWQN
ncbi:hypothetical protein Xen7305DRAFT_00009990, partial [Xenococcus sp. PCC 7305]|uniref:HEAT repeat domain-containing protein n=1 Tax=Xenococcus sp. PCC 7305 TaxID=102125 RepID=UPI0002AC53C1